MPKHSDEFRTALVEGDIEKLRTMHAALLSHMPAAVTDQELWVQLHYARTQTRSIPLKLRYYSHRWLVERGLPSGLPDRLKPSAEKRYPRVASAVGLSLNARSETGQLLVPHLLKSMTEAIQEVYADTKDGAEPDAGLVKLRMFDARQRTLKQLMGGVSWTR